MHQAHAHLYAHVHICLWPWLWLQLWNLNRWMKATGRGLLISVDRWGNVYIRCMSDAPGQGPQRFRAPVSARLEAALTPEPCCRKLPGPASILCGFVVPAPGLCREDRQACTPLPDT